MSCFDVTIVGAGLAGLQCARLLGKHGLRVLLVDRKVSLADRIHTTGIFVRKTLTDFDIPEDCLGSPIRHVSLYAPSHRSLELVSDHDEFRIGRMGLLYERYLNQCLRVGVTWLPNATYVDQSYSGESSTVRLSVNSSIRSIRTRYVIGSDGALSRVARDLRLDTNKEWIVGVENVFTDVAIDGPPRLLCFLNPELAPGYIAWIAYDGEEAHVGVGGYASRFEPLVALEKFQRSVAPIVDLRNAKEMERRGGRIPVGGILRKIVCERGMLIGDAAGAVSPLTAGGLDPCMRLSTLAADVVADYLDTGKTEALLSYSGQRFRSRFTSRIWARRIISRINEPVWAELLCAALRAPLLDALAKQVFFGRGSFPDVDVQPSRESEVPASL